MPLIFALKFTSNLSNTRLFMMSNSPKLFRAFGFIALIFILQACSCYGFDLSRYTGGTDNDTVVSNMICSNLRLTSPLGGLPNGVVTVYWDTLAGATKYQVNLYGAGRTRLGTWDALAPATNLQVDVSEAAVGGTNPLRLELVAFDAYGYTCTVFADQNREAAPPQAPVNAAPTATKTCIQDPSASYC
jgi:hypothetical protein